MTSKPCLDAVQPVDPGGQSRQLLDADCVIGIYRQQPDATPVTIRAPRRPSHRAGARPAACLNNQFILLPGPFFGSSMTSLELALELLESHIAGRRFTPFDETP